jgi:flavin reductase (DIM6/NTAB) family NADH-FMN oxidoreductase RutF
LDEIRGFLEHGPIVLVNSAWHGTSNIMTMGWHMMVGLLTRVVRLLYLGGEPQLPDAATFEGVRGQSSDLDLVDTVVGIGNCHGAGVDKFQWFGLTAKQATKVAAPLIAECYANFEPRLCDTRMIRPCGLFIWDIVKAHVAMSPKRPQTIHYRGHGEFLISRGTINRRRRFRPENL